MFLKNPSLVHSPLQRVGYGLVVVCLITLFILYPKGYAQSIGTQLNLNQGSLSMDVTSFACGLGANVSQNSQIVRCTLSDLTISDLRGTAVGWSTSYTITNFANVSNVVPLCSTTNCSSPRLSISWAATTATTGSLFGITDVTSTQSPSSMTTLLSGGVSNTMSIVSFQSTSSTYAEVVVSNGGSGYTSAPSVSFTGGSCTQSPTGTSSITSGIVSSVTLTQPGLGCTSAPTVGFSGGGGSGATANMVAGAGNGVYKKSTTTNGFVLTVPANAPAGNYVSTITISLS